MQRHSERGGFKRVDPRLLRRAWKGAEKFLEGVKLRQEGTPVRRGTAYARIATGYRIVVA